MERTIISSPLGPLTLVMSDDGALTGLSFNDSPVVVEASTPPAIFTPAISALEEYFAGRRHNFDLKLELVGTEFQRQVWQAVAQIGFGQTRTYGQIAAQIGRPQAVRAVGAAVGRNPVGIVVPCHRVIGAAGLTGYAGGLDRKRYLLTLEGIEY